MNDINKYSSTLTTTEITEAIGKAGSITKNNVSKISVDSTDWVGSSAPYSYEITSITLATTEYPYVFFLKNTGSVSEIYDCAIEFVTVSGGKHIKIYSNKKEDIEVCISQTEPVVPPVI